MLNLYTSRERLQYSIADILKFDLRETLCRRKSKPLFDKKNKRVGNEPYELEKKKNYLLLSVDERRANIWKNAKAQFGK